MKLGRWIVAALLVSATSISAQSVSELFKRPAVMGDSLSQGFYGVTVEKKDRKSVV